MPSSESLDFQIYTIQRTTSDGLTGRSVSVETVPTGQFVSEVVRDGIRSTIPEASSLRIYDGPHYCSSLVFYQGGPVNPAKYWYVHYSTPDTIYRIGGGTVLIVHRDNGEVFYHGPDGME